MQIKINVLDPLRIDAQPYIFKTKNYRTSEVSSWTHSQNNHLVFTKKKKEVSKAFYFHKLAEYILLLFFIGLKTCNKFAGNVYCNIYIFNIMKLNIGFIVAMFFLRKLGSIRGVCIHTDPSSNFSFCSQDLPLLLFRHCSVR